MSRPKEEQPTPGELEVLKVIWRRGPCTVRDVLESLHDVRPRAYTSVMSLMNVMTEKGLLSRREQGRAFVYEAVASREATEAGMLADLLGRVFDGAKELLVARLLDNTQPTSAELDAIQQALSHYQAQAPVDAPPPPRSALPPTASRKPETRR